MLVYGATLAATGFVQAAIAANPSLYGQGDKDAFAPREDRVKAGLRLLTDHGFRLPHLYRPHPRIGTPAGFAYEGAVIPADLRFSKLTADARSRDYRPDDPADYEQFAAARLEADELGYQFYRGHAPFGPANFIVDRIFVEGPDFHGRIFYGQAGGVGMYNPYSGGEKNDDQPFEALRLSIRRYLNLNPEFASFAGFKFGWRARPKFLWTYWDILRAHSETTPNGFTVDGVKGWYLDLAFGINSLISDGETLVISVTHSNGRRAFLTLQDAFGQICMGGLPEWSPEQRSGRGVDIGNTGYILDPDEVIKTNPVLLMKWHGLSGELEIRRKLF